MRSIKHFWSRAAPLLGRIVRTLGLYLDDLCLAGAGCCFTSAAASLAGREGALISAGIWLTVYAAVIARSRRGGGNH